MNILDILIGNGPFIFVPLIAGMITLIVIINVPLDSRYHKTFALLLCIVPLIVGLLGTMISYSAVDDAFIYFMAKSPSYAEVQQAMSDVSIGYKRAKSPLAIGVFTCVCSFTCLMIRARKKRKRKGVSVN